MKSQLFSRLGRIGLFLLCLIVSGWMSLSAQTEQTVSGLKKWNVSYNADYLWPGNGKSNLYPSADVCARLLMQASDPGYSCSVYAKASGAAGTRISFFRNYKGMEFGPSIGYLSGGPGRGNTDVLVSSPTNNVYFKLDMAESVDTMCLMIETRKSWVSFSGIGARIGAGIGVAVVNKTIDASGWNASGAQFGIPHYTSLGWLTWEISPALLYKDISLGLRYVGFGRGGKIPWNTLGAFFGVDF